MPRARFAAIAACLIVCVSSPVAAGAGRPPSASRLRVDNQRISEIVRYATRRSPSFRELVATLEMLDRVVYIEEGRCAHRHQRACLQLMPTPAMKGVRVRVDPRQPIRFAAAQIAHELYHALEIAREPDVVDARSLERLYDRIGVRSCFRESSDCWETRAAQAFESLVSRELAASPSTSPHEPHSTATRSNLVTPR
jgi:hypothetical protein